MKKIPLSKPFSISRDSNKSKESTETFLTNLYKEFEEFQEKIVANREANRDKELSKESTLSQYHLDIEEETYMQRGQNPSPNNLSKCLHIFEVLNSNWLTKTEALFFYYLAQEEECPDGLRIEAFMAFERYYDKLKKRETELNLKQFELHESLKLESLSEEHCSIRRRISAIGDQLDSIEKDLLLFHFILKDEVVRTNFKVLYLGDVQIRTKVKKRLFQVRRPNNSKVAEKRTTGVGYSDQGTLSDAKRNQLNRQEIQRNMLYEEKPESEFTDPIAQAVSEAQYDLEEFQEVYQRALDSGKFDKLLRKTAFKD